MPVIAVAAEEIARVRADATLFELADALVAADVGALAVGDGDDLLAVVSERDVVRALADRRDPSTTKAIDVAHRSVVWCAVDSTVAEVAEEMMEHYVRHVFVEDGGRLVGIVSARDLLGVYAAAEMPEPD